MPVLIRTAALVLALALTACSGQEAARDDSGAVTQEGAVDAAEIAVGDCFNDPEGADSEEGAEFDSLQAVPCDQPHDNEVFHEFELPAGDFPGEDAVYEAAGEECVQRFEEFVGLSYDESVLDFAPITPTQVSWDMDDRTAQCAAFDPESGQVTGTLGGAAR